MAKVSFLRVLCIVGSSLAIAVLFVACTYTLSSVIDWPCKAASLRNGEDRNSPVRRSLEDGRVNLSLVPRRKEHPGRPFVSVLVVVTSAAEWADRRGRIRKQFPRNVKLVPPAQQQQIVLRFVVGTRKVSSDNLSKVQQESRKYADILFLDCLDLDEDLRHPFLWRLDAGASATTSKVMLSIEWAVRHFEFDYFFRLGDDSYFRVDKFLDMVVNNEIPQSNAVVGHIMTDVVFNAQQIYPQGMGYGLTYDVCDFIAKNIGSLLNTAPEDCVVARWLFAYGAHFIDSPGWRDIELGGNCSGNMVLAHKLPADTWDLIAEDGSVVC